MISKRIREEAAFMCSVVASNPDLCCNYETAQKVTGVSREARELAYQAWSHVYCAKESFSPRDLRFFLEDDAEAEALLRTGWSP